MKVADWIGVVVLGGALVAGGVYFVRSGKFSGAGAVLPGAVDQRRPGDGVTVPQVSPTNNTAADIAAGINLVKQGVATAKDIFAAFESFGD